jgi:hypothetical protein
VFGHAVCATQATLPTLIYADLRTDSARSLVQMDNELTSIVKKLAELYPDNQHLKSDFSMVLPSHRAALFVCCM